MMLKSYTVVRKKTVDKKCFKLFTSSTFTNGRLIHNCTYSMLTLTLTITLTLPFRPNSCVKFHVKQFARSAEISTGVARGATFVFIR